MDCLSIKRSKNSLQYCTEVAVELYTHKIFSKHFKDVLGIRLVVKQT